MTYYVAEVTTEYEGYIKRGNTVRSVMQKVNDAFGKGWNVAIWECECEEDEQLALMHDTGTLVKEYTKRA